MAEIEEISTALSETEVSASAFEHDGVLSAILSWLSPRDVGAAANVGTSWAAVARSDGLLWRAIFLREFAGVVDPADARAACKRCTLAAARVAMHEVQTGSEARFKPRAGAAAGVLGSHVVLNGGATTGGEIIRSFDAWDPLGGTAIACTPRKRDDDGLGHGIAVANGKDLPRRWQRSAVTTFRCFGSSEPKSGLFLFGGQDTEAQIVSTTHMLVEESTPVAAARGSARLAAPENHRGLVDEAGPRFAPRAGAVRAHGLPGRRTWPAGGAGTPRAGQPDVA